MDTINVEQDVYFQFKASFLPCMILQVLKFDLTEIEQKIRSYIVRAPNLFISSPVVIDIDKIDAKNPVNLIQLKRILIANGMMPIGVRGGTKEQQEAAIIDGFSILTAKFNTTEKEKHKDPQKMSQSAKIVSTPIRSGMQVYAKECDLIVTASVSPGAELFSDGNIHVYGPLRGRALAGVQGNEDARIFCRALDAELISIAGYYLTKEDMQITTTLDKMIQIYLANGQIRIEPI